MRRIRTHTAGFTLLELIVSIALIAIFSSVLLDRLLYYQEAAEKANMDYTVNMLKLALQIRIGHLMAQNQVVDFMEVARENPVTWVDVEIPGYRGEVVVTPNPAMPANSWYYDRTGRELVYVPGLNRHLQPDWAGRPRVHFRIKVVRPDSMAARDNTVLGLQLAPVEPYRWF
jgi:prepilin-type N-terminal cleavage/methylation domain-containing protein